MQVGRFYKTCSARCAIGDALSSDNEVSAVNCTNNNDHELQIKMLLKAQLLRAQVLKAQLLKAQLLKLCHRGFPLFRQSDVWKIKK